MKTEAQKNAFIAKHRALAKAVLEAKSLDDEYVNTGAGTILSDADFTGINEGLSVVDTLNFQSSVVEPLVSLLTEPGIETNCQNYKSV